MISIQFNYYRRGIRGTTSADTSRGKGNPATDNSNPEAYPSSYPGRRILTLLIRYPSRGTAVRDGMRQRFGSSSVLLLQPYSPRNGISRIKREVWEVLARYLVRVGAKAKGAAERLRGRDSGASGQIPTWVRVRRVVDHEAGSLDSKSQGFGYGVALDLSCHFSVLGSAVPRLWADRDWDGRGTPLPPAHRISSQPRKVSVQVVPGREEASAQQEASDKAIQPQRTGEMCQSVDQAETNLNFFFCLCLSQLPGSSAGRTMHARAQIAGSVCG